MEKIRSLVPVNPHAAEVVAEQVIQGIAGKEAQAVRNPVRLLARVVEVGLGALAEIANRLGALLVGAGPDPQGNAVERVAAVLLKHEGVMHAVRLAPSRADLDVGGEARLPKSAIVISTTGLGRGSNPTTSCQLTLIAACKDLAISLSCSSLGLEPRISGSQNWPTAPFMWPILP